MDKETLQKVKSLLKRGDQAEIARQTGLHKVTVNRFFSGEEEVSDDTAEKIISAAAKVINSHEKKKAKNSQTLKSIINKS